MIRKLTICAAALCASLMAVADPIDENAARAIAAELMPHAEKPVLVKRAAWSAVKSRTTAQAQETAAAPYYIFSRGVGLGYVIVSGDDCLPKVLGFTESGDFDEAALPPHLLGWLDYYANIIEEVQTAGENMSRAKRSQMEAASRGVLLAATAKRDIPVLMTTHWHQTGPYNNRCPYITGTTNRALTGCVATAGAQVAYYYHKDNPTTLQATTPTYGYGDAPVTESLPKGTPMKWELMLNDYNGSRPAEYDAAVADFVFALGASTYLTYGSSTAGQISDLVSTFNRCFNLTGTCVYKGGIAQATWEDMIYNDLLSGHPMVYSGYNEKDGGHAVVIDGYDALRNLFHFNFGRGGSGDGWYTVDDQTGMNGFSSSQGMTYKVAPKKQNLAASVTFPDGFYQNHTNRVRVEVANNGTLPYSGIYVFASRTSAKPSSLTAASSSDKEAVLPGDGTPVVLDLSAKPLTATAYYITVTDNNLNVLAQTAVTPEVASNNLLCDRIEVLGSSQRETHGGRDYAVVHGDKTYCVAHVRNLGRTLYEDNPRLDIYASEDNGQTFTNIGYKSLRGASIDAQSSADFQFAISNTASCPIEPGKLYYAALRNPLAPQSDNCARYETADTAAYFLVKETDGLTAVLDGTTLRFSGEWNAGQFVALATLSSNQKAQNFDLTAVAHVGRVPFVEKKPNSLVYVADESDAYGTNVVKAGVSGELSLQAGTDFAPTAPFKAARAMLALNIEPQQWTFVTVPFSAPVPHGVLAKQIDSHTGSGIGSRATVVHRFDAGNTYMVMAASSASQLVVGEDCDVSASPAENADTAVVGTYVATTAPAGAFCTDPDDATYFSPSDAAFDVAPLRGYFYATDVKRRFRSNTDLLIDPAYLSLAQGIDAARQVLRDYRLVVTDEACDALLDAIADAEAYFTDRSVTARAEVNDYTGRLLALAEETKTQLRGGIARAELDCTGHIVNPSFEEGQSALSATGSTTGWTIDGTGVSARSATSLNYLGVGADGGYIAYSYTSGGEVGNGISQVVEGLNAGLYRLSAKVGSDAENTITLFAGTRDTAVKAHPFGKYYLTEARIDSVVVKQGEPLAIGIRTGAWYKADDFRLTFVRSLTPDEDPTAIDARPSERAGLSVEPVQGGIRVAVPGAQLVSVYTPAGTAVYRRVHSGTATIALPRGLYLVGGKKVAVR